MSDWPLFQISILCLLNAVGVQVLASAWALRQLPRAGRYWLPWACLCLGLVLMVHRRWAPLELALGTGIYDFSQALLSLAVSLLLLMGIIGLAPVLRQRARQDISAE
ncbi:hypothetical protein [Azovibrio restrictus]|uniref:hypothetical protein n=1 Tax=Azovibrio restrictus TaxID=146938 RepID=UPI0026EE8873|nr:hypothetical protein [Azovibrio restrictus]MDD3482079.1 hypothetical protein [Azovibrio restrictus]